MTLPELDLSAYQTVLLDRDGVINRLRRKDYVKCPAEFVFNPGVLDAIAALTKAGKRIFVVTNQRGVGRGVMSEEALNDVHRHMLAEIERAGGAIEKIYYCTALTEADPRRKPGTGMWQDILRDYPDVDASTTVMVGDADTDMQFAANCGIKGIKVDEQ